MASKHTEAATKIAHLVASAHNADIILQELQNSLNNLECPYPYVEELMCEIYEVASPGSMVIIKILEAELLLFFSPHIIHTKVELIFKELSILATTNTLSTWSSTGLTRVKYNDLMMDYQLLFSPKVKQLRLVDLITRKINLLSLRLDSDSVQNMKAHQNTNSVIDHVRHKILIYYLLCDSDYRKQIVLRFLTEEEIISSALSTDLKQFMTRKHYLMKSDEFEGYLHRWKRSFYPLYALFDRHHKQLVQNYVDTNLQILPQYYDTISIYRIRCLLLSQESDIDIEGLLLKMVTANRFSMEVRIDQINGYVYFMRCPQQYGEFDTRIKRVCETIDSISNSIQQQAIND